MGWIVVSLAILFLVRRIPLVRIFAGILVLVAAVDLLPQPPHNPQALLQKARLRCLKDGLWAYKAAHMGVLPERFSQLFPDYMPSKDVALFFDRHAKDFEERRQKAATDLTEVDRNGAYDYLAGKVGGMLVASKTPVGYNAGKKLIRLILENDGIVRFVPEEEYQQRLKGEMPQK